MVRKKGLGKGLSALIPQDKILNDLVEENQDNTEKSEKDRVLQVKIENIVARAENPRKNFDEEALNDLAESIKMYGIIQPIVLTKDGDTYNIIAGERRFRAAKLAGLTEVPAIIKELDRKSSDMISMVENIQRKDLNPYEEAMAYDNLMKEYGLTQDKLAKVVGKSRTYLANIVRLLNLDDNTIKELEAGRITSSQGRALLGISDIVERKKFLSLLINNEISVNELEKLIKAKKTSRTGARIVRTPDVYTKEVQDKLAQALGAKVKLNRSGKGWKLNINFYDDAQIEDFLRKYEIED